MVIVQVISVKLRKQDKIMYALLIWSKKKNINMP